MKIHCICHTFNDTLLVAQLHPCMPSPIITRGCIYIHSTGSAPYLQALLQEHAFCFRHLPDTSTLHYKWLAYLLEEHAMLACIEHSVRRIYAIEHPCENVGDFQKW